MAPVILFYVLRRNGLCDSERFEGKAPQRKRAAHKRLDRRARAAQRAERAYYTLRRNGLCDSAGVEGKGPFDREARHTSP